MHRANNKKNELLFSMVEFRPVLSNKKLHNVASIQRLCAPMWTHFEFESAVWNELMCVPCTLVVSPENCTHSKPQPRPHSTDNFHFLIWTERSWKLSTYYNSRKLSSISCSLLIINYDFELEFNAIVLLEAFVHIGSGGERVRRVHWSYTSMWNVNASHP